MTEKNNVVCLGQYNPRDKNPECDNDRSWLHCIYQEIAEKFRPPLDTEVIVHLI